MPSRVPGSRSRPTSRRSLRTGAQGRAPTPAPARVRLCSRPGGVRNTASTPCSTVFAKPPSCLDRDHERGGLVQCRRSDHVVGLVDLAAEAEDDVATHVRVVNRTGERPLELEQGGGADVRAAAPLVRKGDHAVDVRVVVEHARPLDAVDDRDRRRRRAVDRCKHRHVVARADATVRSAEAEERRSLRLRHEIDRVPRLAERVVVTDFSRPQGSDCGRAPPPRWRAWRPRSPGRSGGSARLPGLIEAQPCAPKGSPARRAPRRRPAVRAPFPGRAALSRWRRRRSGGGALPRRRAPRALAVPG